MLASRARRRHVNTKLVEMPCRRAISVTTAPGASVSSMIRILSSRDQRRRRSTPPRTSTRIYPTLRLALKLDLRRIPVTQQGGLPRRNTTDQTAADADAVGLGA